MSAIVRCNRFGAFARQAFVVCVLAAAPAPNWLEGQQTSPPQHAPDVHWVPTGMEVVRAMLSAARVERQDVLYDLGCGDGRIVITAAKEHGARGVCVDIDPVRIAESRHNADTAGVAERIEFRVGDLFQTDLHDASVVTLYLLPTLNERLRPKLFRELRPGTRVVSNAFDMGDWKPDGVLQVKSDGGGAGAAYFWVMPANVAGVWAVTLTGAGPSGGGRTRGYALRLDQRYQQVTAKATANRRALPVTDALVKGDRLSFTITDTLAGQPSDLRFTGQVTGDRAAGAVKGGGEGGPRSWSAVRAESGPRPELVQEDTSGND